MIREKPDFVLVGGQVDGKVCLIASKALIDLELRWEAEYEYILGHRYLKEGRNSVTADVRDWVQVVADSYPEAFATLFAMWNSNLDGQRQSIATQAAITGGSD